MGDQLCFFDDSLQRAIDRIDAVKANPGERMDCPACTQNICTYERRLYMRQIKALAHLGQVASATPHALSTLCGSGEYAKMRHWGLIEKVPDPNRHPDKQSWRITELGIKFLAGTGWVQKVAHIFDDTLQGFAGKYITVRDVDPVFDLGAIFGRPKEDDDD